MVQLAVRGCGHPWPFIEGGDEPSWPFVMVHTRDRSSIVVVGGSSHPLILVVGPCCRW